MDLSILVTEVEFCDLYRMSSKINVADQNFKTADRCVNLPASIMRVSFSHKRHDGTFSGGFFFFPRITCETHFRLLRIKRHLTADSAFSVSSSPHCTKDN